MVIGAVLLLIGALNKIQATGPLAKLPVVIDAYPSTQPVPLGNTVVLVCRVAGGNSDFTYRWDCPNGNCEAGSEGVIVSRQIDLPGHTLIVNVVSYADNGTYTCFATRGSEEQNASYRLAVTEGLVMYSFVKKPKINFIPLESFITDTALVSNETIAINVFCTQGNIVTAQWLWPDQLPVPNPPSPRTSNTRQSNGLLWAIMNTSNGRYTCRFPHKSTGVSLYLQKEGGSQTFPSSITSFKIVRVTKTSVSLKWSNSSEPNSAGFFLKYSSINRPTSVVFKRFVENKNMETEITGLSPGTSYNFYLSAFSDQSEIEPIVRRIMADPIQISLITQDAKPSKPRNLTFLSVLETTVTLAWLPPIHPNGEVKYIITFKPLLGSLPPQVLSTLKSEVVFPEEYTHYEVAVIAETSAGESVSTAINICPGIKNPRVPTVPADLNATSPSSGLLQVVWAPSSPQLCDGGIDSYTVQYWLDDRPENKYTMTVEGSTNVAVISNLTISRVYYVTVFGSNREGNGLPAVPLSINITSNTAPTVQLLAGNVLVGVVAGGIVLVGACLILFAASVAVCIECKKCRARHRLRAAKADFPLVAASQFQDQDYRSADGLLDRRPLPQCTASVRVDLHRASVVSVETSLFHAPTRANSRAYINLSRYAEQEAAVGALAIDEFTVRVDHMFQEGRATFKKEFEKIPNQYPLPTSVSATPVNKNKNRYKNILPYDENRVALTVSSENGADYINASYIDGYHQANQYIAAQGPILTSISDFWQLVWDHKVPTIIMLTKTMEGTKMKCEQYFPEANGSSSEAEGFTITTTSLKYYVDYEVRTLQLRQVSSGEDLTVVHYLFTGWPDKGVPSYPTSLVRLLYQFKKSRSSDQPVIVHCSAGVGRTGTFIALDCILDQINAENTVDIKAVVRKMRQQRMHMVQTLEQYIFIYNAVTELVLCGNTCVRAVDLRRYLNSGRDSHSDGISRQMNVVKLLTKQSAEDRRVTTHLNKIRYPDRAPWKGKHLYVTSMISSSVSPINAAYVDGYHTPKAFIAAQSPMATTTDDFWALVCENKSQVIVLLCDFVENGEDCCHPFWPQSMETKFTIVGLEIRLSERERGTDFDQYTLSVKHPKKPAPYQVSVLHCKQWSEWTGPSEDRALLRLLDTAQRLHQACSQAPVLVACNDGLGRSGTFIAIWSLIEQMKTEGQIDVLSTVKSIRIQRPGAVDHLNYYKCCFEVVLNFIESFDGYSNFSS